MSASEEDYKARCNRMAEEMVAREKECLLEGESLRRSMEHLLSLVKALGGRELSALVGALDELLRTGSPAGNLEEVAGKLKEKGAFLPRHELPTCVLPPVHDILIRIIEQLPLPQDLHVIATELKKELERGLSPDRVQWAVEAVASLMVGMRAQMEEDKRQAEVLIDEVTKRLVEMEEAVVHTQKSAADRFAANRALDEKVSAEVNGIHTFAEHATDFSTFRQQLLGSLDAIRNHFEVKRREDAEREVEERKEVEKLKAHVDLLESEMEKQKATIQRALEESHRDALTGCLNRLAFNECIETEVARTVRYKQPLSVVMFDLDHFKDINDSFGHQAGDEVLRAVAKIARAQLRAADYFCRYGGEEFVAVLPSTVAADAFNAAEKVRVAVEAFKFHSKGARVPITISGGVAEFGREEKLAAFIGRADAALYKAKHGGRNRTETA